MTISHGPEMSCEVCGNCGHPFAVYDVPQPKTAWVYNPVTEMFEQAPRKVSHPVSGTR